MSRKKYTFYNTEFFAKCQLVFGYQEHEEIAVKQGPTPDK